eukprot:11501695-Alexandrium_andersonii.AAC.1
MGTPLSAPTRNRSHTDAQKRWSAGIHMHRRTDVQIHPRMRGQLDARAHGRSSTDLTCIQARTAGHALFPYANNFTPPSLMPPLRQGRRHHR